MWLFRHKFLADGTISRYKARLLANGSTQIKGIDVDETFSPVVKPGTIQTRSLYGLKQAPRAWFQRFSAYITRVGFSHSRCDSSLFIYKQGMDTSYVLLYVDDIVLAALSKLLLQQIIASLHQEFSMTNLGSLNYFLGISVTRDSTRMFLSQRKYAIEILEQAHMIGCNPSQTPVDNESKLGDDGDPVADPRLYRSLAGSLHAEAEYRGVANAVAETCWLRNLLRELHTPLSSATLVYCHNVSAVYLSSNPVQHQRTKHIEIDIHFVRDLVAAGQVRVLHVSSRYQYADVFTKGLPTALFEEFRSSLSVRCPPAQTAGELPMQKQVDGNIELLLLGLLWRVRLMYRYAAPSDTHMFVVHIEHGETMKQGKAKIPRLRNPRLETIDTKMKYEIYGEFEAMMRENIDWRKEPLGVALKKDNAIVQYPSSIPGEHVYLANTVVDKWCLLNAAFYLYLNTAKGGHGNYATGQSYGVYPHHLYRYSTAHLREERRQMVVGVLLCHRRKRCSTVTRCSSLRDSRIDIFWKKNDLFPNNGLSSRSNIVAVQINYQDAERKDR
ncbi:ribonuclease H-like domain-containing protein, partial [Tanacetum coccineum]